MKVLKAQHTVRVQVGETCSGPPGSGQRVVVEVDATLDSFDAAWSCQDFRIIVRDREGKPIRSAELHEICWSRSARLSHRQQDGLRALAVLAGAAQGPIHEVARAHLLELARKVR